MRLSRRSLLSAAAVAPVMAAFAPMAAFATTPDIYADDGVAVDGTDVVAYFTDAAPVAGDAAFAADQDGATWLFSNAANRDAFVADPQKYLPAFGGYCAFAVSRGYIAPTIPEAWTIFEDRLYLNANLRARRLWLRDVPGNIALGEANWPGVLA